MSKGWGNLQCPWKLEVQPGQSIHLTVIDFEPETQQHSCIPIG